MMADGAVVTGKRYLGLDGGSWRDRDAASTRPRARHVDGELAHGDVLNVAAHTYAQVDDCYQFVLLMEGMPPFEIEVLLVPRKAVSEIRGG